MSQFYWLTIGCIQSMELLGLKKVYGSNENNQLSGVVQQIMAYKMTNKIRVLVTFHSLAFGSTIDQIHCHMCLFCCGSYASYNVNFFIVFILKYDYFYNYNILVSQVDFTQQNTRLLKPKNNNNNNTKLFRCYLFNFFLSKQKCTMFVHVQM